MNLLDLPTEVLVRIASLLDVDSLIALSYVNYRLLEVSQDGLRSVRTKKSSPVFMDWVRKNGYRVRRLDFSNASWNDTLLMSAISECRHITELNVLNAENVRKAQIFNLRRLEKLRMAAQTGDLDLYHKLESPAFSSLRELHLEVPPEWNCGRFVIDLLNLCERVEVVHLHTMGCPWNMVASKLPVLAEKRWRTLRTVVCSRRMADVNWMSSLLLRAIFENNSSPRIQAWIERDQECHIYQDGHCNDDVFYRESPVVDHVKLLEQYRTIDMSLVGGPRKPVDLSRGPPRSVRVLGPQNLLTELNIDFPATLTELDLTECHGYYTARYRENLIVSMPSLVVLAFPLCMFFVPVEDSPVEEGALLLQRQRFEDALKTIRLKKLFVKGICHEGDCGAACTCNVWNCQRCAETLTSNNFIDMFGLQYLEELTLDGVSLESSAYHNMVNQNVQTMRLCLNAQNDYSGLGGFILRCKRLENLKIESLTLDLTEKKLWAALANGVGLKQLCVASGRPELPPLFDAGVRLAFRKILQRVEFLHLHIEADPTLTRACFLQMFPEKALQSKIVTSIHFLPSRLQRRYINISGHFTVGRSLCIPQSFIGSVPTIGWDRG